MTKSVLDIFPLTPAQAGMLISSLREPEPGLYVVQMRFSLAGELDEARLTRAWQSLGDRHEVLRTAIVWDNTSSPVNVVMAEAPMSIEHLDMSRLSPDARSAAVQDFLTRDRRRGFDLRRAPLSRITLLAYGCGEWEMVWTHHHLILDGWSTAHLMSEFWSLYTGKALSAPGHGFRGFASRVATTSEQRRAEADAHWAHLISGGAARIGIDRHQAEPSPDPWTERQLRVPPERLDRWDAGARRHGATRSTLVHAAWAMTLRAEGLGPDELTFGTVADNRGFDADDVVGLCVASTPMRVTFPDIPLSEWLRGVAVERATSQELAGNLADHRRWSDDGAEVPFRYILAVEGYAHAALSEPATGDCLEVHYLGVRESTEFAITAGMPTGDPCLKLTIDTRRVAVADAVSLLDRWAQALDHLAAAPSGRSLMELISPDRASSVWRTLPERIRALAFAHPARPAFRDASETLTLDELVRASGQIAAWLRNEGLGAGDRVGVLAQGSVAVPIAVLAILMAGGVVVPLDPRHPAPYRAAVISAAGVRRILTAHPDIRPEWAGVAVTAVSDLRGSARLGPQATWSGRAGQAFLIYDAGCALCPRATAYNHSDVMESASTTGASLGLGEGDHWVATRPDTGTMSPWETWVAPLSGGCTILAPGLQHKPDEVVRLIESEPIAVLGVSRRESQELEAVVEGRARLMWAAGVAIDPADIESVLAGRSGVTSFVVRDDPDEGLQAVVSAAAPWTTRELTRALRSALPERLMPRVTLADAETGRDVTRQLRCEHDVHRLWSKVLETREVPLDTPFFDLGGDSLLLFAVLSGLRNEGWTDIDMTDLFAYPTIRSLARRLSRPAPVVPASSPPDVLTSRRAAVAARRERRTQ